MSELIENVTTQEVGETPVKKEKKFKFGWFVLTLMLPVISLCLQFVGMIPTVIRASAKVMTEKVTDMNQVMQISNDLTMEYMGEILLIYHLLNIVVFFLWYYFGCVKRANTKLKDVCSAKNIGVLVLCTVMANLCISGILQGLVYVIPDTMAVGEIIDGILNVLELNT